MDLHLLYGLLVSRNGRSSGGDGAQFVAADDSTLPVSDVLLGILV